MTRAAKWNAESAERLLRQYFDAHIKLRALHDPKSGCFPVTLPERLYEHGCFFWNRYLLPEIQITPRNKQCYLNAWRMYRRSRSLRYAEGYVAIEHCPIPVMHGWCVDAQGLVRDPSVENERGAVYFGVCFTPAYTDQSWASLVKRNAIGIFENLFLLRTNPFENLEAATLNNSEK